MGLKFKGRKSSINPPISGEIGERELFLQMATQKIYTSTDGRDIIELSSSGANAPAIAGGEVINHNPFMKIRGSADQRLPYNAGHGWFYVMPGVFADADDAMVDIHPILNDPVGENYMEFDKRSTQGSRKLGLMFTAPVSNGIAGKTVKVEFEILTKFQTTAHQITGTIGLSTLNFKNKNYEVIGTITPIDTKANVWQKRSITIKVPDTLNHEFNLFQLRLSYGDDHFLDPQVLAHFNIRKVRFIEGNAKGVLKYRSEAEDKLMLKKFEQTSFDESVDGSLLKDRGVIIMADPVTGYFSHFISLHEMAFVWRFNIYSKLGTRGYVTGKSTGEIEILPANKKYSSGVFFHGTADPGDEIYFDFVAQTKLIS